jgi:arylsulfatase A-like enzyme
MTGRYPARLGITDWIDHNGRIHPRRGRLIDVPYLKNLPLTERTVASALREGGYATWHVGKWHLGERECWPDRHGFDVNIAGCEWGLPPNGYFSPWNIPGLLDGRPGEHLSDHLTDEAISLIKKNQGSSDLQPFFLNLWYYDVHTPIQGKPELIEKYSAKAKRLGLDAVEPFKVGEPCPSPHKKGQRVTRRVVQSDPVYAAMIETLDANIGRLLDLLDELKLRDNTLVLFTSDNGGLATSEGSPTSNAPLAEGKGWMYEGGVREPLLASWPGVVPVGSRCSVPVISTDFFPTFLDAAGLPLEPESHLDGTSILPLLRGGLALDREALYWHYPHYGNQGGTPGSSVRAGNYKLIEFFEDNAVELYDLSSDPGERYNLAERLPDVVARLRSMLHHWRDSVEAKLPAPNPVEADWGPVRAEVRRFE